MVMEKRRKNYSNYTYGNVAYDLQPEISQERKNRRKIKNNKRVNTQGKYKKQLLLSIGIAAIFSFMLLTRFAAITKMTYDIRMVKSEVKEAQKENENIKVEIAKSNNIRNIEEIAIKKYGMISPSKESIIYLDVKPLTAVNDNNKIQDDNFIQKLIGFLN